MQHRGTDETQPMGKIITGNLTEYAARIQRHGTGFDRKMQA